MPSQTEKTTPRVGWILPGLCLLYLAIALLQSAIKLLWADELITFYIARQPGWPGIWHALRAGADPNPPLIHILVQASTAVLGASALAIRLPAILAVLLAIVSLWSILRRWVTPGFAAAGILAFMCTRGFDYSYDARSYAPLMGFSMAALACWSALPQASAPRRILLLCGLAAALALGISSNYYGVLAFFPIAAGEALRNRAARRLAPGVWLALLLGALPLLAYLPLIRHNIAEFAPHAWNRPHASMIALSYFELVEGIFWPVLLLLLFSLIKKRSTWPLATPETAALTVLLLYPFLGFAVAIGGAGMISPRCVAPVCCGFGLALGLLASHLFASKPRAAIAVVALFAVWLVTREGFCASELLEQRRNFLLLRDQVARNSAATILVGDSAFVLPLSFYSTAEIRRRILFPIDFGAIHRFEREDSGEQNLWAGRNAIFPFPVLPFSALPPFPEQFTVIARPGGWLTEDLTTRGVHFATPPPESLWYGVGGVFTPMAHPETRILKAGAPTKE